AGSSRSPLWRGGAIVFGPQPRDYSYRINKKQRRLALRTALSAKVAEQQFVVVDALSFEKPKTREMISLLASLGLADRKVLVITKDKDENVLLSSRNIPGVSIQTASDVNVYMVMNHDVLLATKDAVLSLQEVLQ
ncbi:MAG: 50S ribosomal protein L4, partial [bacterium]